MVKRVSNERPPRAGASGGKSGLGRLRTRGTDRGRGSASPRPAPRAALLRAPLGRPQQPPRRLRGAGAARPRGGRAVGAAGLGDRPPGRHDRRPRRPAGAAAERLAPLRRPGRLRAAVPAGSMQRAAAAALFAARGRGGGAGDGSAAAVVPADAAGGGDEPAAGVQRELPGGGVPRRHRPTHTVAGGLACDSTLRITRDFPQLTRVVLWVARGQEGPHVAAGREARPVRRRQLRQPLPAARVAGRGGGV